MPTAQRAQSPRRSSNAPAETPTPAQRTTTPLPENIALPPSAAPVIRAEFRFPLASPRRRFESKSETKEYDSDECATPRRVSAPSPSRNMRAASRETEKLGCGRVHDDKGPVVVEKDKPKSQHVITINTIKPAASPPAKSSTNHAQSPKKDEGANPPAASQKGHGRPRARYGRGRGGRRGGRTGTTRGPVEESSALPVPTKGRR
ncbi:hypothetical protein HYQ44_008490 [Verticillium longisporum]|nr:hypothetical protein HYQ44_008490 [Verticillium longisporum]